MAEAWAACGQVWRRGLLRAKGQVEPVAGCRDAFRSDEMALFRHTQVAGLVVGL